MNTYRTVPSVTTAVTEIRVPGVLPATTCDDRNGKYRCTRPAGHDLRHAAIRWWDRGVVRAVWDAR